MLCETASYALLFKLNILSYKKKLSGNKSQIDDVEILRLIIKDPPGLLLALIPTTITLSKRKWRRYFANKMFCTYVTVVQEERYFIASVLNLIPKSTKEGCLETDKTPLCVKFKCYHCPKGINSILVSHLMQVDPIIFTLPNKIIKSVSFDAHRTNVSDEIALKISTPHIQVKILPELSSNNVCEITEKSLLTCLKDFHCQTEPECEHCSELHQGREHSRICCKRSHKASRHKRNSSTQFFPIIYSLHTLPSLPPKCSNSTPDSFNDIKAISLKDLHYMFGPTYPGTKVSRQSSRRIHLRFSPLKFVRDHITTGA